MFGPIRSHSPTPYPRNDRSPTYSRSGLVCSSSPAAAAIGTQLLAQGANAFDAAVAVAAAECITMPALCGLGGNACALLFEKSSEAVTSVVSIGSVPVGNAVTGKARIGLNSITVPGEVAAWHTVSRLLGTRPMPELLAPAIAIARDGCLITPKLANLFHRDRHQLDRSGLSRHFAHRDGALTAGDTLLNPGAAATLESLSSGGPRELYGGEVGAALVRDLRRVGSTISVDDLEAHEAEVADAVSIDYRGHQVSELPPASQGLLVLQALQVIEQFDVREMGHLSAKQIHLVAEATALATAQNEALLGGVEAADVSMPEALMAPNQARRLARTIRLDQLRAEGGSKRLRLGCTTASCTADAAGNLVVYIHSLGNTYGSGIVSPESGILLNNAAGRGFRSDSPDSPIARRRRPSSPMNCWLARSPGGQLAIGATLGGDYQIQGNVQMLSNLLDFQMEPQSAVEATRWHASQFEGYAYELHPEEGLPRGTIEGLASIGYRIGSSGEGFTHGVFQVIVSEAERGFAIGASDPRGDGLAASA